MTDREIAYEQNVTNLERAWRDRITIFATEALRTARESGLGGDDARDSAYEDVRERLLASTRWENVEAADISDIATEAVDRVLVDEYEPSDSYHYNR